MAMVKGEMLGRAYLYSQWVRLRLSLDFRIISTSEAFLIKLLDSLWKISYFFPKRSDLGDKLSNIVQNERLVYKFTTQVEAVLNRYEFR